MKEPEHDHNAATKGYTDTKLSRHGGNIQGGIGRAGNKISHLGPPVQDNDAVRLSFANENFLRRDGTNWIRGKLSLGGFRAQGIANPKQTKMV